MKHDSHGLCSTAIVRLVYVHQARTALYTSIFAVDRRIPSDYQRVSDMHASMRKHAIKVFCGFLLSLHCGPIDSLAVATICMCVVPLAFRQCAFQGQFHHNLRSGEMALTGDILFVWDTYPSERAAHVESTCVCHAVSSRGCAVMSSRYCVCCWWVFASAVSLRRNEKTCNLQAAVMTNER